MRRRIRRHLAPTAAISIMLALLPAASAPAISACALAAGILDVTVGGSTSTVVIRELAGEIAIETSDGPIPCAGEEPDTSNTDTILFTDLTPGTTTVRLSGPILKASDPDGSDEIKLDLRLGSGQNAVVVSGRNPANLAVGRDGVNLNADVDDDVDLTLSPLPTGSLTLVGTDGADQIEASGGSGTGGHAIHPVRIEGLSGDDTLTGGAADDVILPGSGDDTIDCGEGPADRLDYSSSSRVSINAGARTVTGIRNGKDDTFIRCERLRGSDHNDILRGSPGSDHLAGGEGADRIIATPGNDVLAGGEAPGSDDASVDTLDLSAATGGAEVGLPSGNLAGPSTASGLGSDSIYGFENLIGTRFSDILTGNDEPNLIVPGRGSDDVDGFEGVDTVSYANAPGGIRASLAKGRVSGAGRAIDELVSIENVIGSPARDVIRGDGAANVLLGGRGRDRLYAKGGRDRLEGGSGRDFLHGGKSRDLCIGGSGRDRFRSCERRRQ